MASRSRSPKAHRPTFNWNASIKSGPPADTLQWSSPPRKLSPLWRKLYWWQRLGVHFCLTRPGALILYEQGTGKTFVTLGAIEQAAVADVLLVSFLTNKDTTWAAALEEHLPQYVVFDNFDAYKKSTARKKVLLVHYEAVRKNKNLLKRMAKYPWGLVVFDECDKLKARQTASSRMAARFRHHPWRIGLTGTPMDASPVDLWGTLRFVDPTVLSDRWADFEEHFIEPVNIDLSKYRPGSLRWHQMRRVAMMKRGKPKIRKDRLDEFHDRVAHVALRVGAEVLGLEEPEWHEFPVSLFGEQRRLYESMESKMLVKAGGVTVAAALTITRNVKLEQLACGFLIDEDDQVWDIGQAKQRALRRIIPRLRRPFVVFCKFLEDLDTVSDILEEYGIEHELLYGKVKDTKRHKRRTELIQRFQAGKLEALVCQQRTGGRGTDLYAAADAVLYSIGHSYIDFDQMRKRIHRHGQTRVCRFWIPVVRNTIDEDKFVAVKHKRSVTEVTLERLKQKGSRHGQKGQDPRQGKQGRQEGRAGKQGRHREARVADAGRA